MFCSQSPENKKPLPKGKGVELRSYHLRQRRLRFCRANIRAESADLALVSLGICNKVRPFQQTEQVTPAADLPFCLLIETIHDDVRTHLDDCRGVPNSAKADLNL